LQSKIIYVIPFFMKTVPDIFDALGGPAQVARLLNTKQSTASEMKRRKTIPLIYWPRLIKVCADLNNDLLVKIHTRKAARK
jgi:hypothetical protein